MAEQHKDAPPMGVTAAAASSSLFAAEVGNGTAAAETCGAEGEGDAVDGAEQGDQQQEAAAPPLVPGVRAERLQTIYAQALGGTLKKLSWLNVAGCYPTVARRAEGVLRTLQQQMANQLQSRCEKEFEKIMENRQVVVKLNELEALVGEAERARDDARAAGKTEEPTPPHTLPPQTILAAHLHPALARHQSQLHARLQATQSQNALLADEVRRQRAEAEALLARLEDAAADVRAANEALAGVVDAVAEETRLDTEHV